ncbi:Glyoxylase, beta-lactamase superfamily II [Paracoccus halophilus]|uniref:Glyoxylase, beta-lactamase superfamily II n=1 Tax=Paracoccus halophilus TaxID=376733 RepID=A0A099F192_9RHOB|nr:MBL fold metallo-hydrolase [Paracoccus halophilus]KGJ04239.1 metallo-beta-lactamase [Paracoccus halophilus]SFA52047.1 Glyoxylase, beta-lactamase superfamily II [Paracoccus halophilus]
MNISRRFILTGTAALAATAGLPLAARRGWALTSMTMGDVRIDSLSDGHLELPAGFFLERLPEGDRGAILDMFDLPTEGVVVSPCNLTLLRTGDRVVLFDAGSGPDFVPTAGRLPEALAALGIAPGDVTDVLFTHAHPDHLWGLLDEFDEPLFPNAALHMGAAEFAYWSDPRTAETIGEEWLSFAVGAMRRLTAVGDRIRQIGDGDEVLPGIRAVSTPGHTPGHMSYAVGTPGQGVFVTGDFVTSAAAIFRPELGTSTDSDPEQATATRRTLLPRLADEGWTILGYHLPEGGIGRIARDGAAFRFEEMDA